MIYIINPNEIRYMTDYFSKIPESDLLRKLWILRLPRFLWQYQDIIDKRKQFVSLRFVWCGGEGPSADGK